MCGTVDGNVIPEKSKAGEDPTAGMGLTLCQHLGGKRGWRQAQGFRRLSPKGVPTPGLWAAISNGLPMEDLAEELLSGQRIEERREDHPSGGSQWEANSKQTASHVTGRTS